MPYRLQPSRPASMSLKGALVADEIDLLKTTRSSIRLAEKLSTTLGLKLIRRLRNTAVNR